MDHQSGEDLKEVDGLTGPPLEHETLGIPKRCTSFCVVSQSSDPRS